MSGVKLNLPRNKHNIVHVDIFDNKHIIHVGVDIFDRQKQTELLKLQLLLYM